MQIRAIGGKGINAEGFCQSPNLDYIAKQLEMSKQELLLNFETLEKNGTMRRFYDSEHKFFAQNDRDIHALYTKHGKENVEIIEQNVKTLFEPCPSCKKQFIIRKKLYNIKSLTIEATRKNKYEFVKTNEQFLTSIKK